MIPDERLSMRYPGQLPHHFPAQIMPHQINIKQKSNILFNNCLRTPIWRDYWFLHYTLDTHSFQSATWHWCRIVPLAYKVKFLWKKWPSLISYEKLKVSLSTDREAREIMYLVSSLRLSVCLSIRPWTLSRLNCLTYDLDSWFVGWPWPRLGWDCRSRS